MAIIGFLIHARNQRSNYRNLMLSELLIKDKDVMIRLFKMGKGAGIICS